MADVVVVGTGQAGLSCVARLRTAGFEGTITLIGSEPVPPYQRPPLSKAYLLGQMTLDRMYLRPKEFYADNGIEMITGQVVTGIDTAARIVTAGEISLPYGDLVLATGSDPIRLPADIGGDKAGIYYVRTLADADAMAPEFAQGRRLLIVGGGYIGLEAAAVGAMKGLRVTLVEAADRILKRVASPETSDFFRARHREHGVTILESSGLAHFTGTDRVTGAVLADGSETDADFAIVGVGITPGTGLAAAAGCTIENGIRTDEQGRTSVSGIWAAGDCASFPYRGAHIRLESVPNAIDQAEVVAENILGAGKEYVARPWFWSDQYDIKLQIAGLCTGYDRVISRTSDKGGRSFWYYRGDVLLAVDAANDPRGYMVGKRLIEAGKSPAVQVIADPSVDLRSLLK
ncbi:MAG: FAD-dependent oxidoreductase [Rhodobacteraceae bacterium]|nr:FAD-dependent oxidoreductase [Paracoccaceae bacterium]